MKTSSYAPTTAALLLPLLFLGGCGVLSDLQPDRLRAKYGWTEEKMLAYGWLEGRFVPPETVYCYHTLADPECFSAEQHEEASRLIGYIRNPVGY